MIYAFRSGSRSQTLDEHIRGCVETFNELRNSKLWHSNLSEELAMAALVLHDVGKVFYQRDGDLSFTGHEFISAYVFWKAFGRELPKREELLYTFPIIFHHHAMGVKGRLERLRSYPTVQPSSADLEELSEILAGYMTEDRVNAVVEAIETLRIQSVVDKIRNKIDEIWNVFHGRFARDALRLLLVMIVCDYEGSKGRGASTRFGDVIAEVLRLYKNPPETRSRH